MIDGTIDFFVEGVPQVKGNHAIGYRGKGVPVRRGKELIMTWARQDAFIREAQNAEMRAWERAIQAAGLEQWPELPIEGPWEVEVIFFFHRPQKPKDKVRHITRPDADKLVRAVLDACTGKAWIDDSQVADLLVRKRYTENAPGARVVLRPSNGQGMLALREVLT